MKKFIIICSTILILIIGVGDFYWFSYRPSQIRTKCQQEADQEFTKLFDRNFQTQEDGRVVYKDHPGIRAQLDDLQQIKEAAQDTYQPCLQRNGQ